MHIACAVIKGNIDILHIPADGYGILLRRYILKIVKAVHRKTTFLHATDTVNSIAGSQSSVIPETTVSDMRIDDRPCLKVDAMTSVITDIDIRYPETFIGYFTGIPDIYTVLTIFRDVTTSNRVLSDNLGRLPGIKIHTVFCISLDDEVIKLPSETWITSTIGAWLGYKTVLVFPKIQI